MFNLRGLTLEKSVKLVISFFLQKTKLYMLVDEVPKHLGAKATVNHQKTCPKEGNTRTFITFSDDLFFLL